MVSQALKHCSINILIFLCCEYFFCRSNTCFMFLCPQVVNMDYGMEGTNIALAVFIPTAIILVVVLGIYVYFAKWVTAQTLCVSFAIKWNFTCCTFVAPLFLSPRLQGKSIRMPTSSPPYDNMTEESAFDNPVYESGVSTDDVSMRDVDSHNTSVLSWSPPIWLPSCRHLMSCQQRALSTSSFIPTPITSKTCDPKPMMWLIQLWQEDPTLILDATCIFYFHTSSAWTNECDKLLSSHLPTHVSYCIVSCWMLQPPVV